MRSRALAFGPVSTLALTLFLSGCSAPEQLTEGDQLPDSEDDSRGLLELPAFRALDMDDDGEISADEIEAAPGSLTALDGDGNGVLSDTELSGPLRGPSSGPVQSPGATFTFGTPDGGGAEAFDGAQFPSQTFILGTDGDDALEIAELPPQMQAFLAGADTDGDGAASAAEIMALMGAEAGGPVGGEQAEASERDASAPQTEGGGRPQARDPLTAALDADRDGAVSEMELAAAAQSLRGLDADGDGRLTTNELRLALSGDSSGGDPRE